MKKIIQSLTVITMLLGSLFTPQNLKAEEIKEKANVRLSMDFTEGTLDTDEIFTFEVSTSMDGYINKYYKLSKENDYSVLIDDLDEGPYWIYQRNENGENKKNWFVDYVLEDGVEHEEGFQFTKELKEIVFVNTGPSVANAVIEGEIHDGNHEYYRDVKVYYEIAGPMVKVNTDGEVLERFENHTVEMSMDGINPNDIDKDLSNYTDENGNYYQLITRNEYVIEQTKVIKDGVNIIGDYDNLDVYFVGAENTYMNSNPYTTSFYVMDKNITILPNVYKQTPQILIDMNATDSESYEQMNGTEFSVRVYNDEIGFSEIYTINDSTYFTCDIKLLDRAVYNIEQVNLPEGWTEDRIRVNGYNTSVVDFTNSDYDDYSLAYVSIYNSYVRPLDQTDVLIRKELTNGSEWNGESFNIELESIENDYKEIFTFSEESSTKRITGLNPGTYTVKELNLPSNWVQESISDASFVIEKGDSKTITIVNDQTDKILDDGQFTIKKVISPGSYEGESFYVKISDSHGNYRVQELNESNNYTYSLTDLEYDDFTFEEVDIPYGWEFKSLSIDGQRTNTLSLDSNEEHLVEIKNHYPDAKEGVLALSAIAQGDSQFTDEAFNVILESSRGIRTEYQLNKYNDYSLNLNDVELGDYKLSLESLPQGWTLNSLTIDGNETDKLVIDSSVPHSIIGTFEQESPKDGEIVLEAIGLNDISLEGESFRLKLESPNGLNTIYELNMDNNYRVSLNDVEHGIYKVEALDTPENWQLKSLFINEDLGDTINVASSERQTIRALYDKTEVKDGKLSVRVESTDLKDEIFKLEIIDDLNNSEFYTLDKENSYTLELDNLYYGEYIVKVLEAPKGWALQTNSRTMNEELILTIDSSKEIELYFVYTKEVEVPTIPETPEDPKVPETPENPKLPETSMKPQGPKVSEDSKSPSIPEEIVSPEEPALNESLVEDIDVNDSTDNMSKPHTGVESNTALYKTMVGVFALSILYLVKCNKKEQQ